MAETTSRIQVVGLTTTRDSAIRRVRPLRVAAGALAATVLIIALMAAAGRLLPPHPDWARPTPGGLIELTIDA
jgi:hypothetical protein